MQTTLQQTIATTYTTIAEKEGLWSRFMNWCNAQEANRLGWLGAALAVHGCVATPITLFFIILSGNLFFFWILAIAAMGAALITNLAALPTKITLPVFFLSLLVDVAIIISCVSIGLNVTAALAA